MAAFCSTCAEGTLRSPEAVEGATLAGEFSRIHSAALSSANVPLVPAKLTTLLLREAALVPDKATWLCVWACMCTAAAVVALRKAMLSEAMGVAAAPPPDMTPPSTADPRRDALPLLPAGASMAY